MILMIRHVRLSRCRPSRGRDHCDGPIHESNVRMAGAQKTGTRQYRKCVTTRNGGTIEVIVTHSSARRRPILKVLID